MKANKIEKGRFHGPVIVILLLLVVAAAVGVKFGYDALRDVYIEQCVITDMSAQVEITSGKMVPAGTIAEELGLKKGANLAMIDFSAKTRELLAKVPNLRAIRVSRQLPDKVIVTAEERMPIARLGIRGSKTVSGRVVDTEGVVFICQRGTQTLPVIREPLAPGMKRGERIQGRLMAALRLVEACREPEFLELGVLEVDTSKRDFLVATLGNYNKVKICWDEMDESTANARKDLLSRLTKIRDAIRSRVTPDTVIWNATMPGEVFADTQGKI